MAKGDVKTPRRTPAQLAYHREYERARRAKDPEKARAAARARQPARNESRAKNPQPARDRWNSYRARHPDYLRIKDREACLRRYGVTIEQYDAMLQKQACVCAVCGRICKTGRRLAVDHDSVTGRVRGLLCAACNRGIGCLDHDVARLLRAIRYLGGRI